MNRKSFQLFVERYEAIKVEEYSERLLKAIALCVLDSEDYEQKEIFTRLIYIKDNTHRDILIPLHVLDSYVNPTKEAINKNLFVSQEFLQNDGESIILNGSQVEQYLFNAIVEIQILISNLIRRYNFVNNDIRSIKKETLPYPILK